MNIFRLVVLLLKYLVQLQYRVHLLIFLGLLLTNDVCSQTSRIHIVTIPNNQQMGFPIRFTINEKSFRLKNGQCLEWQTMSDSVHIIMDDRRWVNISSGNLHLKAENDIYIRVFWGWKENEKKKIRLLAEQVCKSCFDELKSKCKNELTE